MRNAVVTHIKIADGARIGHVIDPGSGKRHTHGLGAVGDPLRPFLGHRAEGYALVLPDDLRTLTVRIIDFDGKPNEDGYYPTTRAPLSALGADDVRLS